MTSDVAPPRIAEVIAMRWLQQPNDDISGRTPFAVLFGGAPEELPQVDDLLSAM